MTTYIDKVTNSLQKLKSLGEGKDSITQRDQLINSMRIDLTFFENLPPTTPVDMRECILAREVYEYATFLSLEKGDIEAFERNFATVKTYYDEFEGILPPSQKKYTILGLYLLYLLSFNKISEYHTEIELIPISELNNVFIKVPMSLEQYFVEGSYNKILSSKQQVPHPAYQFFIDKFVDAIRYEVARSAERAYESIAIKDMSGIFMIKSQDELNMFITQNSMKDGVEWKVASGRVFFHAEKKD
jgi:26S proteasome regulatory subunit N12